MNLDFILVERNELINQFEFYFKQITNKSKITFNLKWQTIL